MRKLLLLLILVIILVSLNWFRGLSAQDLSSLSEEAKQALKEKYTGRQGNLPLERGVDYYETPSLFDSSASPEVPERWSTDKIDRTSSDSFRTGHARSHSAVLVPFGQGLFQSPRGESMPPNDIASSEDYILGPGDNVVVFLWGRVEKEYNLTLDREGKIFIPEVGELAAWGMNLAEFRRQAKNRLSKVYSEFDLTVSLGKIRSIRIYLTGEVERPGAYTVSSLTSLFNALYLGGGPTENGSMRAIRLMRSGKAVATVDVYKFLLEGDNSLDVKLQTGDVIFVPVAGARVAVQGQVKRPAIYELIGEETTRDLLALAGNAAADAYLDRVMLERIAGRKEWEVLDLNLNPRVDDEVDDIALMDGDRMTVYSIFDAKKNMVAVYGYVKHPGYYERNDSTTISALVSRAQLQPYDVCLDRANLFRRYSDLRAEIIPVNLEAVLAGDPSADLVLQDRDSLHIYSLKDVQWDEYVYIEGEVQHPGRYNLYDNMTANDLVFLAGAYTRSASRLQAEIAHVDSAGQVSLEYVDMKEQALRSTLLREGDRLYVRQVPEWQLHRTVRIDGEVAYPGEYVLSSREEKLSRLLERCGGFTSAAFPRGLIFERGSIDSSLARLRIPQQLERSNRMVEDSLGNVSYESFFEYEPQSVNRLIIDIDHVLATDKRSESDIVLQPGDRIYVPAVPSGITVMGAVGSNGTIKFAGNKKVKYYVHRAGNFTPQADKKGTRLIKANGEVFSGGGTLGKKVDIGDIIVIPSKIEKESHWQKTLTTVLTTTTGVLTSILLIDRL